MPTIRLLPVILSLHSSWYQQQLYLLSLLMLWVWFTTVLHCQNIMSPCCHCSHFAFTGGKEPVSLKVLYMYSMICYVEFFEVDIIAGIPQQPYHYHCRTHIWNKCYCISKFARHFHYNCTTRHTHINLDSVQAGTQPCYSRSNSLH
jgi:hypothetical protein